MEVIPNWADGEALAEDSAAGARFRAEHGLGERLVVLYSGNLGLAHRFDAVVAAARELATTAPAVLFLFVGAGPRLAEVQAGAAGLDNVRFLPYQPREALRALYSAADIHLVTLRDEVAGLLVPSKYAAALAGSRPVLLVGGRGTDLHTEITRERLGWALAHDPRGIAAVLAEAVSARAEVVTCGKLGRKTFERSYTRVSAVARWQDALLGLRDSSRDEPGR